ncbi:glycosyltransferase family 4 protein [Marinobacter sp. C2H3]|uniref:glycosyltransferase family 4 protein n=1 Tax=Marinobacter sp. C2H3 TaxID=3119003 RepID=UPI00300ED708
METKQAAWRPQHITIVSETFPPEINGVANTLGYLCRGLVDRGHQVTVIRPRQPNRPKGTEASALDVDTVRVPGLPLPGYPDLRFGLALPCLLRRRWSEDPPDVIYVATQGPLGVAAVRAARSLGLYVISGFHTRFDQYSRYYGAGALEPLLKRYGRWFHNQTRTTLVPTERMVATVRALGIPSATLWSRGVDGQRFHPRQRDDALRESWGLAPSDLAVLYVGRLAKEKNLCLALACFERLRALHPRARLVLVGSGPLRPWLEQRYPHAQLCGVQRGDDLARHYASADLFLFPSKTDTFGNVVLEAMASALAVVAFDDGAAGEHLRTEANGIKVALDDDQGFIDAALRLADQPSLLERLRRRARQDALDVTWPTQIERFEHLMFHPDPEVHRHGLHQQSVTSVRPG